MYWFGANIKDLKNNYLKLLFTVKWTAIKLVATFSWPLLFHSEFDLDLTIA